MDIIRFTSTLKPSGSEYKKVVYWNRYVRTKLETIILLLLFIAGIALLSKSSGRIMFMLVGAIFAIFPIIVISQFNTSIKYHLANRDKTEEMPCEFTIMVNGILAEIKEADYSQFFRWEDASKLYDSIGYYMFFDHNDMKLMINKSHIDTKDKQLAAQYIKNGMKENRKRK